jgi:hypothetical protein
MPLVRLDEEIKKEDKTLTIEQKAKAKVEKKETEKKTKNKKWYPVIYVACCVVMFGLGLLVIALINLGLGNGFVI